MTGGLDREAVRSIVDDDGELLNELRSLLDADCDRHIERLAAAVDDGDNETVGEVAHALKGAFASFGETAAWRCAVDLEQRVKAGARDGGSCHLDRASLAPLEAARRELLAELAELVTELRGG